MWDTISHLELCTHNTNTQEITAGGDGPSSWKEIMNFRM